MEKVFFLIIEIRIPLPLFYFMMQVLGNFYFELPRSLPLFVEFLGELVISPLQIKGALLGVYGSVVIEAL
jgi:hypothetical protein